MNKSRRLVGALGLMLAVTLASMGLGDIAGARTTTVTSSQSSISNSHRHGVLTGTPVVRTRQATVTGPVGQVCAQATVGAGWYLYLYLNRGDVNWLAGLGYAAASAALCAWVAPTIIGGIICGVAAYAIWTVIQRYAWQVPSGYCVQAKFSYAGHLASTSLVRRSC